MTVRRAALPCLLAAMVAASPAQAACLTPPEAESIALVALPTILRDTGLACIDRLPSDSLLRQTKGPFITRFDDAAERAWPDAKQAIVKLSDPAANALLQSEYARPLLTNLLAPLIAGRINPNDCGTIDRFVSELAPLPPRNMAGAVVTALQYFKAEKAKGKPVKVPDLPLCAEPQ